MGFRRALDACYIISRFAHAQCRHPSGGSSPVGTPELALPDSKSAPPGRRADPYLP